MMLYYNHIITIICKRLLSKLETIIIYLLDPLHEYQHHVIIAYSQYQHDLFQMTNVKVFVDSVVIIIIRYL